MAQPFVEVGMAVSELQKMLPFRKLVDWMTRKLVDVAVEEFDRLNQNICVQYRRNYRA